MNYEFGKAYVGASRGLRPFEFYIVKIKDNNVSVRMRFLDSHIWAVSHTNLRGVDLAIGRFKLLGSPLYEALK